MYLIIIFILGTLCVIFNEKIGEFFSRIIDLDMIFLSKKEKKIKQQQQAFLKDSPEILFPVYEFILQKYARASGKRRGNEQIEKCLSILPETIYDFFKKYDRITVDTQKFIDIKSLKIIDVNNNRYAIIGKDPDSHDLFIVNLDKNTSQDYIIYQISDEQHILSEIKDENSFGTFINFVCFMTSHYSDSDLLDSMAQEGKSHVNMGRKNR